MASRLREDYGIDLAQLEHKPTGEEGHQREEVQKEIDELRLKIGNLGNVNLEALDELNSLENPFSDALDSVPGSDQRQNLAGEDHRQDQYRQAGGCSPTRSRPSRGHFQKLFRDLFGGGHGDIVMEEGVDILESGIEIVARPPGKEPRSISLLSGGEKTLTCVALLLAMFRSRPSPFCVLDEVDAAAGTRPISTASRRCSRTSSRGTQFIIVTHSKKTMTCANTIYGVTMQESGVSKQVSVRFEGRQRTTVTSCLSGWPRPTKRRRPRNRRLHIRRLAHRLCFLHPSRARRSPPAPT